ncbi:TRAP transporter large permease subunit [Roseomonas sp. PWR1]|uniref:TRAP transporter large permease subunit n=1 Tax=Roseomonas nitratireducens TaxID=2820810 RepID=A0ABS4ARR1_9PROT|nr:TRAP transporter large permease subunit [Neoroseomonas nitratireducens]MBP0464044.1 TRAP transporter large permease subunit [Neoroseomonas nitratireducens]
MSALADVGPMLDLLMLFALCTLIMVGVPVVFILTGCAIVFGGLGILLGAFDPFMFGALAQRVFGTMTSEVLIAIPLFVYMGMMLEKSKIAPDLLEAMGRLFGTLRGGLAVSVTLVGALLAASTGIVGATVVTMGLIALPAMMRHRYDPAFATGTICAAGTLGQIIPPSTVMVILGEVLAAAYQQAQLAQGKFSVETISVGQLFAGSMIPGLMLAGIYILYQVVICRLRPELGPAMPAAERAGVTAADLARALIPPITLIVAVLGSILAGVATPTEAASVGAVGATLLAGLRIRPENPWPIYVAALSALGMVVLGSLFDLRIGRQEAPFGDRAAAWSATVLGLGLAWGIVVSLRRAFGGGMLGAVSHSTMTVTAMIFATLIGATLFSLVFRGLGGDEMIRAFLEQVPGGKWGALAVVMIVIFILGFPLDFVEIVIIVVPIVGPVLLQMDIDPIWLGVLIAMNLQTSFLTPPLGPTLFYIQGVLPQGVGSGDVYRGVTPFVILQVIGLALVMAFPVLATWLPDMLF